MKWKPTPVVKIYESLGAVADGRVEVDGTMAKVYSSSRNKFYSISYEPESNSIMVNDNGSYWQGYLGYPAVAYLLHIGVLDYKAEFGNLLRGLAWKDINQKFKSSAKGLEYVLSTLEPSSVEALNKYVNSIHEKIKGLNLNLLGARVLPPEGY